jgi:energy-coupling factor transporter ATP-binding protein EcfA2
MLERVEIENYKAFGRYELPLGPRALLIGPNNAGKSTLVSALRLIAHLARPAQIRRYARLALGQAGVEVDLEALHIPAVNVAHRYSEQPSRISAFFSENLEMRITVSSLGPSLGTWFDGSGGPLRGDSVGRLLTTSIGVVPPVGPLELEELPLTAKYVRAQMEGPLSPRHFRNQWYHLPDDWEVFRDAVRRTLPEIDVYPARVEMEPEKGRVIMEFRVGSWVGEVGWLGHGVQVWLEILTHLMRLRARTCVILDEPDIYLHPDLQRRVVEQVNSLGVEQFIVASHSVDILNEFAPEDVIVVDKSGARGRALGSLQDVQRVTFELGSVTNSYLARLARSRVCLFVEGGDFEIVRRMAGVARVDEFARSHGFGVVEMEGSGNWERVLGVNWVMENLTGEPIRPYLLLDRDYRCQEEVDSIVHSFAQKGVRCHVWARKELENYLLIPKAIARAINEREGKQVVASAEIEGLLRACADEQRHHVEAQRQAEEFRWRRPTGVSQATVNQKVLEEVAAAWDGEWAGLAGGKRLLTNMRRRLQEQGKHGPTNSEIMACMEQGDVDQEVVDFCATMAHAVRRQPRRPARRGR